MEPESGKVVKSEDEWRRELSPEVFEVTRRGGTEPPFTGPHLDRHEDGTYTCVCCGADLFSSGAKFDSGTGWPSFFEAIAPDRVELRQDTGHGMIRTEVLCAACGAHLGHVFDDGPHPTGKRYCMNGCALDFEGAS
jgi:peptide-methionine (R)-S-oxide reductase